MKTILFILPEHPADWEYSLLAPVLHSFVPSYQVQFAARNIAPKTTMGNLRITPDLTLADLPTAPAATILIGGEGWRELDAESSALLAEHCRQQKRADRLLAGICDGAWFLAANGLLNEHHHTGNHPDAYTQETAYTNARQYLPSQRQAIRDGNLITASGLAATDFTLQILHALGDIPAEIFDLLP